MSEQKEAEREEMMSTTSNDSPRTLTIRELQRAFDSLPEEPAVKVLDDDWFPIPKESEGLIAGYTLDDCDSLRVLWPEIPKEQVLILKRSVAQHFGIKDNYKRVCERRRRRVLHKFLSVNRSGMMGKVMRERWREQK